MLESLYAVSLCEGSRYHFNRQADQAVEDTQTQIKAALKQQSLIHADESGIRVEDWL